MNYSNKNINGFKPNQVSLKVTDLLDKLEFEHSINSSKFLKEALYYEFRKLNWYENYKVDPNLSLKVQFYEKDTAIMYYFSNKARSAVDLLKIQHLYSTGKIRQAIYIVLSGEAARKVASNLANAETLKRELEVFKKIITCPILLIGLY